MKATTFKQSLYISTSPQLIKSTLYDIFEESSEEENEEDPPPITIHNDKKRYSFAFIDPLETIFEEGEEQQQD